MLCHWTIKEYDYDKNVFVLFAAIYLVYWQLLQNNNVVKNIKGMHQTIGFCMKQRKFRNSLSVPP